MAYDFQVKADIDVPVRAGVNNCYVDPQPIKQIFADIFEWAEGARLLEDAASAPTFRGSFLPDGYRRSLLPPSPEATPAANLIAFNIEGGEGIEIKTRYALPVHFVTMRALELVPGLKLFLKDETRGKDKEAGRDRLPPQKIYRINLAVGRITQGAGRLLFNVPSDAELHERRTDDAYRRIVPAAHVITKLRKRTPPKTSEEILRAIEHILRRDDQDLAYDADEMAWLLRTLLALGDKWHWAELEDRLPTETGREFPPPL